MRQVYLIRHGMPDFPGGEMHCLGLYDMPLGARGRMQAAVLARALRGKPFSAVFCSRLSRAVQTAEYLSSSPVILEGLEEMSAGDWDGLSFSAIRARWPELFAQRGADTALPIPGSEDVREGQRRFLAAVGRAIAESDGDIAIVAHSTVIQSLLCALKGIPPEEGRRYKLPYCSYCVIGCGEDCMELLRQALVPRAALDEGLCAELLTAAKTPERVRLHCMAVGREAARIAPELNKAGAQLDLTLINNAALLHDIARTEPGHAETGAAWLEGLGYTREAELVRRHHELGGIAPNEAAVVYIADKLVCEDRPVTLAARFAGSLEKCLSSEARRAHSERYETALAVRDMINSYCGKEVIS